MWCVAWRSIGCHFDVAKIGSSSFELRASSFERLASVWQRELCRTLAMLDEILSKPEGQHSNNSSPGAANGTLTHGAGHITVHAAGSLPAGPQLAHKPGGGKANCLSLARGSTVHYELPKMGRR